MSGRPRIRDDLMELFQEKKEHRNQSIGDILLEEFPKLEKELEERKSRKRNREKSLDTDLFEGEGLLD